jgi:hypothetical protein
LENVISIAALTGVTEARFGKHSQITSVRASRYRRVTMWAHPVTDAASARQIVSDAIDFVGRNKLLAVSPPSLLGDIFIAAESRRLCEII